MGLDSWAPGPFSWFSFQSLIAYRKYTTKFLKTCKSSKTCINLIQNMLTRLLKIMIIENEGAGVMSCQCSFYSMLPTFWDLASWWLETHSQRYSSQRTTIFRYMAVWGGSKVKPTLTQGRPKQGCYNVKSDTFYLIRDAIVAAQFYLLKNDR